MANEAVAIEKSIIPAVRRTCSGTAQISKGAILCLNDANLATNSAQTNEVFAGIAAADKDTADGASYVAAHLNGVFDCALAPTVSCSTGALLMISGANLLKTVTEYASISGGMIVGKAEEEGTTGETIRVRLLGY